MPLLGSPELSRLEERILVAKSDLAAVSRERWEAALRRDERGVLEARKKAADKMLDNCEALAHYVSYCCPNVARDLLGQGRSMRSELDKMRRTNDSVELHNWYKASLIPLVKHSEVLAHLAATTITKRDSKSSDCYQWPVQRKIRN